MGRRREQLEKLLAKKDEQVRILFIEEDVIYSLYSRYKSSRVGSKHIEPASPSYKPDYYPHSTPWIK